MEKLIILALFSTQVNLDEKVNFLTDHHHDLLNLRAGLDARLKEAKAMNRETAAQHIAAEVVILFSCLFPCLCVCVVFD